MFLTEIDQNRAANRAERMDRKANEHAHALALDHMRQLRQSSERKLNTLRLVS